MEKNNPIGGENLAGCLPYSSKCIAFACGGASSGLFPLPLLPLLRLPARSIATVRQPAFAGLLALRRVCHGVRVIAFAFLASRGLVRPAPAHLDGLFRGLGGNQSVTPTSDQVSTAYLEQRLPDREVVFGLEELHQSALHLPVSHAFSDVDFLLRERVQPSVVKCCGDVRSAAYEAVKMGSLGDFPQLSTSLSKFSMRNCTSAPRQQQSASPDD